MNILDQAHAILKRAAADTIEIKPSHKGLLHQHLGIPEGEHIPLGKLMQAKNSKDPAIRREANFAINARSFNK